MKRESIVLMFKNGWTVEELAVTMDVKRKTVEGYIRRWMKQYPEGRAV